MIGSGDWAPVGFRFRLVGCRLIGPLSYKMESSVCAGWRIWLGQSPRNPQGRVTMQVQINSHHNPFLFSGTKVVDGYAQMLVTSVGMNTIWGELMSTISRDINEQTPL